jgi:hypothetical protein
MNQIIVYETCRSGHRQTYADICRALLNAEPYFGSIRSSFVELCKVPYLICSSCDEFLGKFLLLSLARMLLNRRTVGIAIRAEGCLENTGLRNIGKRLVYRIFFIIPRTKIYSILPFFVEPRLAKIVKDWIYDPQFWDLPYLGIKPQMGSIPHELSSLESIASGRKIIVSLGTQNLIKGSEYFCRLYISSSELAKVALFVLVGNCSALSDDLISEFLKAGGIVVDRHLSDEELISTYMVADLIWCCYHPLYNQSSGIFGRAFQLKVNVIVRTGSYLHCLQKQLYSREGLSLCFMDLKSDALILEKFSKGKAPQVRVLELNADRCENSVFGFLA